MTISNFTRGSIFIIPLIPSVLITIFNLYYLLTVRALRTSLNNHVIILLLFCGLIETLTDMIWTIYFDRNRIALLSTPAFCLAWIYFGSTMYIAVFILMAWASIERHIFVFYPHLFRTKTKRLYFHYIPLAICVLYPATFYFVMFFILPCPYSFYYAYQSCSRYSCLIRYRWASLWDSIAHFTMPAFTTVIFSVLLFIRVVYKRYRARGQIDWRNYKKMTAQLLPISILYMAMQFPPLILYTLYSAGVPYSVGSAYYSDGLYFTYWVVLLTPFATVISLPDLKTKCLKLLFWRRNRVVQPVVIEMARRNVNQSAATGMARPKVNQPTATEMAPPKVNQPTATEMAPPNVNQPTANEVASTNVNQPTTVEMTPPNANQPTTAEMTPPNANQPTGAAMTHLYLDQPVSVLPDVQ